MRLDHLEVSGGFLDGLDLRFADGLNVLIGPRGAGKTSVLELVRFALGIRAMTEEAEKAAAKQARAVLGDGTVTVYASVHGEPLVFTRTGLDDGPTVSASYSYVPPLIKSAEPANCNDLPGRRGNDLGLQGVSGPLWCGFGAVSTSI